jgi:ABC-type transporter Mla subunit MlaD
MLRIKTLLGETYVELTPGRRSSGMLPEGGSLPAAAVSPTVELDEVLQSFDPQTRRAFATWMQSQAAAVRGRGADINASFGLAPGFVEKFDRLFAVLDAQRSATRKMISTTGEVFDAISRREGELRGLVTDSQRLFGVTAARNQDLAAIFRQLPRFERESTQTLPDLASFASAARPVVRQLLPAADELTPTFQALNRLSPEFQGFFGKLSEVVAASKRGLPAFEHVLDRLPGLLDAFQPFLRNANPMVRYIGENRRYVTALFANTTAASLARDVALPGTKTPVHYLRTSQTLDPLALSFYPRPPASARDNAYLAPNAFDQLTGGLPVLTAGPCQDGEPPAPTAADPETLVPLVQAFAFRSDGGSVAAPGCREQGDFPGFPTAFPQLRAEP